MNHKHFRIAVCAGIVLADILFFGFIDPAKVSSALLAGAFGLLFLNILGISYGCLWLLRKLTNRPKGRLSHKALSLAAICSALIALQSIGQLTPRDVVAFAMLIAIFWFYASYHRPKPA